MSATTSTTWTPAIGEECFAEQTVGSGDFVPAVIVSIEDGYLLGMKEIRSESRRELLCWVNIQGYGPRKAQGGFPRWLSELQPLPQE